jgi:hypothetical protein
MATAPYFAPRIARGAKNILAAAVSVALLASGCDNPACIWGGDCFGNGGGGGGLGSNAATVPENHAWLLPGAPSITGRFPTGLENASTTPIVLTFSESMAQSSLNAALELVAVGGFGVGVPLATPTLVGDGRMLVVLPITPLQPETTYELRFRENSIVFDLSGTTLPQPDDRVIHSFTVAAEDEGPVEPRLVATWPPDGTTQQSATGEIAIVFDRPIVPISVNVASFAVTVDGLIPAAYPAPQAMSIGAGSVASTDTRAWIWRATDNTGQAVPHTQGGAVQVSLSPAGNEISALDGEELPPTFFDFQLAALGAPLSAELVSLPMDAIGIANLDGSVPLDLSVQIAGGQPDDRLGVFLFGASKDPQLGAISLFREFRLGDLGFDPTIGFVSLGATQLDLTDNLAPLSARFADGLLDMALRLERQGVISPVRLLDTEDSDAEPQGALLDITRPVLTSLGSLGTQLSVLRSDLRDLVVVGRADEPVRAAEVSTTLGNNGVLAPTQAVDAPQSSLATGLFAAAPVALGVLPPAQLPLPFTVTIYDRALNGALVSSSALFSQVGASGPAPALPGNPTVTVEVFDSETLAPVPAARVFTHDGAGGAPVPIDATFTDVNGRATLLAAPVGETFVTVDATLPVLFDLFTFQGVPTSRLSVPLRRAGPFASFQGTLVSSNSSVPSLTKWASDSRLFDTPGNAISVQACSFNPILASFECVFGPGSMSTGPLGAAAFVATVPPPNEFSYSAATFLKGWGARLPRNNAAAGLTDFLDFHLDSTLDAPGVSVEEHVLDGPIVDLDATALAGLGLGNLNGGGPRISVESRLSGLGGALLAGHGAAFPTSGTPTDTWRLRAAFPGAVDWTDTKYAGDQLGSLVQDGIVAGQPYLRAELRDLAGNISVRRPRFDLVPVPAVLQPISTPGLITPGVGGSTGGASFEMVVSDVLDATFAQPGIYRATLTDFNGRSWVVWRPDGAGATLSFWTPPIAALGGVPLADGPLTAGVTVFAWPTLDVASFMWTDLERDYDVLATSGARLINQP